MLGRGKGGPGPSPSRQLGSWEPVQVSRSWAAVPPPAVRTANRQAQLWVGWEATGNTPWVWPATVTHSLPAAARCSLHGLYPSNESWAWHAALQ